MFLNQMKSCIWGVCLVLSGSWPGVCFIYRRVLTKGVSPGMCLVTPSIDFSPIDATCARSGILTSTLQRSLSCQTLARNNPVNAGRLRGPPFLFF